MTPYVASLPHRGILKIEGEDKAPFLQGLISNDIFEVTSEKAIYATLLTPQGRFLYDFFITEHQGSYRLEGDASSLDALLKKLSLYKLRSRVTLTLCPELKVFALWGKDLKASLERSLPPDIFRDPRLEDLGARAIGQAAPAGFQLATPEDYDLHRLTLGVPEGGRDLIPEKAILLESGLDELNAISWTKGCYMGQELTARTKYRGLVRKRLFPVKIEGATPEEGTEVTLKDKAVGELRTSQESQGLALLRLEAFQAFQEGAGELRCGATLLKPYVPVWMRLAEPS